MTGKTKGNMKNVLHVLTGVGVVIIGLCAVGLAIKAAFGIVGGVFAVAFWAAVLAGMAFLTSAIWHSVTGSR